MLKSWKFWTVMVGIGGLAVLFAFGFTRDPKLVPSPLVGHAAPGFAVTELDTGAPLSLEALRGTPFVLNFWASWCQACKEEAPLLEQAYEHYEQAGVPVRFVGIAIQDTAKSARAFAHRYHKQYYLALDTPPGDVSLNWGLYGVPETFFVDARGIVRFKQIGPLTWPVIQRQVARLLAEPAGASAAPAGAGVTR